jgi:hypothetical protein
MSTKKYLADFSSDVLNVTAPHTSLALEPIPTTQREADTMVDGIAREHSFAAIRRIEEPAHLLRIACSLAELRIRSARTVNRHVVVK